MSSYTRLLGALAIALVAALTNAWADEAGFSYKGVGFGIAKPEFAAKLADWDCSAASQCTYTPADCRMRHSGDSITGCDERNTFGGAYLLFGVAEFRDDKLVSMYFKMSTREAAKLMESATGHYGKATEVDDKTTFRTRAGATFDNVKMIWRQSDSTMTVWQRSGRIDEGAALLMTNDEERRRDEQRKANAIKGAKDF